MSNNGDYYSTINFGSIEIKQKQYRSPFRYFFQKWKHFFRQRKLFFVVIITFMIIYFILHNSMKEDENEALSSNHQQNGLLLDKLIKTSQVKTEKIDLPFLKPIKGIKFPGPTNERQKKVVEAFLHAWKGYKEFAWGEDELRPLSKTSSTWFGLGLTIIDSLDTMYIMNLHEEFEEARDWVEHKFDLAVNKYNSLFEITIRILGGLLSAYHLSGERVFLERAYDLGNRSLSAFNTPSHIPLSDINLMQRTAKSPSWTSDSSVSEVASLQLEFKDLARLTGDVRFSNVVSNISQVLHRNLDADGLVPIYVDTNTGRFTNHLITLGARGDSYYEYLLKQWIQNGAKENKSADDEFYLLEDWLASVRGIKEKLVRKTKPNNLTFVGEMHSGTFSAKMDHLVCFLPGNLALGYLHLKRTSILTEKQLNETLDLAKELTETCYQMYAQMQTGLSPEIVYFNTYDESKQDLFVKEADKHNLLRPETVESLYYLYKITHDRKYQEYGWKIFQSFENYTRVEHGYSSISDVSNPQDVKFKNKMESFFLAETLKYFYLLFEDDDNPQRENVNLEKWIFNTEAHLMPVFS